MTTDMSIDECITKVGLLINSEVSGELFANKRIAGRFTATEVKLWRRRDRYNNAFAPVFYGVVFSKGHTTIIRGGFHMMAFTRLFLYFTVIFLMASSVFTQSLGSLIMVLPILFLVLLGYGIGKSEEEEIITFLIETLEAQKLNKNDIKL